MIDRRIFLAGTGAMLLAAPRTTSGQSGARVPRVGSLATGAGTGTNTLSEGLRTLDYDEGRTIVLELRYAEGRVDRT